MKFNLSLLIRRSFSLVIDITFSLVTSILMTKDDLNSTLNFKIAFGIIFSLHSVVIPIVVFFQSNTKQTLGDIIMKIQIVDLQGNETTMLRCIARQVLLSILIVSPVLDNFSILISFITVFIIFAGAIGNGNIEQMSAWDYFTKTKVINLKK